MKTKYQRLFLFVITIMITIGMYGCDMSDDSAAGNDSMGMTGNVELNPRQLQILEAQGLPQSYGELSASQKRAIVSIEELLTDVESKYGMEFCYAGYVEAGALEPERLMAYPAGGDESTDSFSVTRASDGTITDRYMNIALRDEYSRLMLSLVNDDLASGNAKVFAEVTDTTLTSVPNKTDRLEGNVEGASVIFIDGAAMPDEQFESFVSSLKQTLEERRLYGTAQIVLLKPDVLEYLTAYNYTDYLDPEYYTERESISIDDATEIGDKH